jgi:hypothetical protein
MKNISAPSSHCTICWFTMVLFLFGVGIGVSRYEKQTFAAPLKKPSGSTKTLKKPSLPSHPIPATVDNTVTWHKAVSNPQPFIRLGKPIVKYGAAIFKHARMEIAVNQPVIGRLIFSWNDFKSGSTACGILENVVDSKDAATHSYKFTILPVEKLGKIASRECNDYCVYAPRQTRNRNTILFLFGNPSTTFVAQWLYTLDVEKQKLQRASDSVFANPTFSSSPDGRYVFFLLGGNEWGGTTYAIANQSIDLAPVTLSCCDLQKRLECVVGGLDETTSANAEPVQWTYPHTILYSKVRPVPTKIKDKSSLNNSKTLSGKNDTLIQRPDIYEWDAQTQKISQTIEDGFLPTPSPDGSFVAFFGSEDVSQPHNLHSDWQESANGMALTIAHPDGSERTVLDVLQGHYPKIIWLPGDAHLLTLQQTQERPNAKAELKEWDIRNQTFRRVADFQATDKVEMVYPFKEPNIIPLGLTNNGQSLWVATEELTGIDAQSPVYNSQTTLNLVDLKSGVIAPVITMKNIFSFDWSSS